MPMPALAALDLDALDRDHPRPRVIINGAYYALATAEDLSAAQRENLRRVWLRMREIEQMPLSDDGFLPEDVSATYDRLARYICEVALHDADTSIIDEMTPLQMKGLRDLFLASSDLTPLMVQVVRTAMQQLSARVTETASASSSDESESSRNGDDDSDAGTQTTSRPRTPSRKSPGTSGNSARSKPATRKSAPS